MTNRNGKLTPNNDKFLKEQMLSKTNKEYKRINKVYWGYSQL